MKLTKDLKGWKRVLIFVFVPAVLGILSWMLVSRTGAGFGVIVVLCCLWLFVGMGISRLVKGHIKGE